MDNKNSNEKGKYFEDIVEDIVKDVFCITSIKRFLKSVPIWVMAIITTFYFLFLLSYEELGVNDTVAVLMILTGLLLGIFTAYKIVIIKISKNWIALPVAILITFGSLFLFAFIWIGLSWFIEWLVCDYLENPSKFLWAIADWFSEPYGACCCREP